MRQEGTVPAHEIWWTRNPPFAKQSRSEARREKARNRQSQNGRRMATGQEVPTEATWERGLEDAEARGWTMQPPEETAQETARENVRQRTGGQRKATVRRQAKGQRRATARQQEERGEKSK